MSFSFKINNNKLTSTNGPVDKTRNASLVGSTVIEQIPKSPSQYSTDGFIYINSFSFNLNNPEDLKRSKVLTVQNRMDSLGFGAKSSESDINCNFLTSLGVVVKNKNKDYSLVKDGNTIQPVIENQNISLPNEYRKKRTRNKTKKYFKSKNDPFYTIGNNIRNEIDKQEDINLSYENRNKKALDITSYLAEFNLDPAHKRKLRPLTKNASYSLTPGEFKKRR